MVDNVGNVRKLSDEENKRPHEVLEELQKDMGYSSLHMNKVDINTLKLFKEIANTEYKGDYGTTLKVVLDGFINYQYLFALDARVSSLEAIVVSTSDCSEKDDESDEKLSLDGKKLGGW